MKNSEILQAAYELIQHKNNWTQGSFARDQYGNLTSEFGDSAVFFCSLGAVNRISQHRTNRSLADENVLGYLKSAIEHLEGPKPDCAFYLIYEYNDASTHEEVLVVFRKAIELAKADENGIS